MKTKEAADPEEGIYESMEDVSLPENAESGNGEGNNGPTKDEAAARSGQRISLRNLRELTKEEDETPVNLSWRTIIGGDILASGWLRRQFWMIILITAFTIIYVGNRYACQQEAIERSRLNDTLLDRKYKALTRSSELLEKTLRSNIEEELADSTIQTSITPLYGIKTDE